MGSLIGIIGSGADKFTPETIIQAFSLIQTILTSQKNVTLVSGHSPVGGIDIWSEHIAVSLGLKTRIFAPRTFAWDPPSGYGFKARNLDIARWSDIVHVIIPKDYPISYTSTRFKRCYHCDSTSHIKSGACWTAHRAIEFGNKAVWHVIT